jgi:hypothetical protein
MTRGNSGTSASFERDRKNRPGMRRWIWLVLLVLYAIAGIIDGASRVAEAPATTSRPSTVSILAVAFCAGLFWPIDLAARGVLGVR